MNNASLLCSHLQIREMFQKGLLLGRGAEKKTGYHGSPVVVLVFDQVQSCGIPEPKRYKEVGGIICPLMR